MNTLGYIGRVLVLSIRNFIGDSCFRHSAALSFYTLFSLAPMAMISVHVASLFAAEVDFERELVQQFTDLVGPRGAEGVSVLLTSLKDEERSRFQLFVGALVLMFSATNIFVQLQAAFNQIFCVVASGRGIVKKALDRLVSLGIILSLGLIMILSLVIDSAIVLLQNWLASSFPGLAVFFIALIQYTVLAVLATAEIYALLHFLPDVHLPRRYKLRGCAVIALLLVFGKSAISGYISTSQLSELGGAAASVIVLMLWIYYSSLIVFFGAEMIRSMAAVDKLPLLPKRYAVKVKSVVVEEEDQAVVEEEHPPVDAEAQPALATDEEPHPPATAGSAGNYTEPAAMAEKAPVSPKEEVINARAAQN
jgi:membrane protein